MRVRDVRTGYRATPDKKWKEHMKCWMHMRTMALGNPYQAQPVKVPPIQQHQLHAAQIPGLIPMGTALTHTCAMQVVPTGVYDVAALNKLRRSNYDVAPPQQEAVITLNVIKTCKAVVHQTDRVMMPN